MATQSQPAKRRTPKVDTSGLYERAILDSFRKLDPRGMVRNPVMFVVEVGTVLTLVLTFWPDAFGPSHASRAYNGVITLILFVTVLFANFAEALAEGRGKAQAASLRRARKEAIAHRRLPDGRFEDVGSSFLRRDDVIRIEAGELVPTDGEVIEGLASVDESAVTGESVPVLKEPGTDIASSVVGGTTVVSDFLLVQVTADPGGTFLDKMIALVEGAQRRKTPNEIALTVLLAVLTFIFLMVTVALGPAGHYAATPMDVATLVALLVCLIPTTIGGLLSAIGIAGMDRVAQFNVIAMSGKAVETAGDIDVLILDKTGTITYGNRMASDYFAVGSHTCDEVARFAMAASWHDDTPEGRSILALSMRRGFGPDPVWDQATCVPFSAKSRMSGLDLPDGSRVRKGAADAVRGWVQEQGGTVPDDWFETVRRIAEEGGTPLGVARDRDLVGVVNLADTLKEHLRERFDDLRAMGIRTIMYTGDNVLTARTIARRAGVDDFVAEATPEEKLHAIRAYQAEGKLVAMTGDGTNDAPALAQADLGLAMNSGTSAAKEAANMVDLDSDPSKLIDLVAIGKQLLITRGSLTTFSIANDVAKYFAIIPAIFLTGVPELASLNVMALHSPKSAVLSALIFNALIIPALVPLALKGVRFRAVDANAQLLRNVLVYGLGGIAAPFLGIKLIDLVVALVV